jgi:DNA-binding response OmpR family regulator
MGCDKFIQKPFRLDEISRVIRELLDNKAQS